MLANDMCKFGSKINITIYNPSMNRRPKETVSIRKKREKQRTGNTRKPSATRDHLTRANLQLPLLTLAVAIDYISMFAVRSIY